MKQSAETIIPAARRAVLLAAAFMIAAGFCAAAYACYNCVLRRTPTVFQYVDIHTETIRRGGASAAGAYYSRGLNLYRIAAGEHEDPGLSSREEAYALAIADLNEAVRLSANSREPERMKRYLKTRGNVHLSIGNFALAAADYSEAILLNPDDKIDRILWRPKVLSDGLYMARGAVYYIMGDYDKAIEDFEAARRTRVADNDFLAETAIGFAKKRITAGGGLPSEAEKQYFRGLVYYNDHDNDIERYGIKYFKEALRLDSGNAEYHRMLGLVYYWPYDYHALLWEEFDRSELLFAMWHFDKAIRLAPDEAKNYAARALVSASVTDDWLPKRPKRATGRSLRRSYTQADDDGTWWGINGHTLVEGDDDTWYAIEDYTQAIRLAPRVPEYRVGRAFKYLQQRNYSKAIDDYIEAVRLDTGIIYRVSALLARDRNREIYSIADRRDENFDRMICELLKRLLKNGAELCGRSFSFPKSDDDKASDHASDTVEMAWHHGSGWSSGWPNMDFVNTLYTELLRKSPHNAEYYYQRGRTSIWWWRTEYDKAIADFSKATRLRPNVAIYHKALGDAYLRKGECEKAAASHLRAMRLDPNAIYIFLGSNRQPIKGYRTALDETRAAGGTFPLEQCPIIEEDEDETDEEL